MMVVKVSNAKRGSYSDDIPFKELLQYVGVALGVILAAAIVASVSMVINNAVDNMSVAEVNASVEQFNSLPLADRQAIIRWDGYEYVPETFLRPYQELKEWHYPIPPVEEWNVRLIVAVALCVLSLLVLLAYAFAKSSDYYLYDLPRSRYGLVLFCLMFAGWLIFLADFLVAQLCRALERVSKENDAKTNE